MCACQSVSQHTSFSESRIRPVVVIGQMHCMHSSHAVHRRDEQNSNFAADDLNGLMSFGHVRRERVACAVLKYYTN